MRVSFFDSSADIMTQSKHIKKTQGKKDVPSGTFEKHSILKSSFVVSKLKQICTFQKECFMYLHLLSHYPLGSFYGCLTTCKKKKLILEMKLTFSLASSHFAKMTNCISCLIRCLITKKNSASYLTHFGRYCNLKNTAF